MNLNYELMFKSAVSKLQTDAKAYNELLRIENVLQQKEANRHDG